MTTPRIASLTALAASLLFVILTITQANGVQSLSDTTVSDAGCYQAASISDCAPEPINVSFVR